jgi:hypothetical protein
MFEESPAHTAPAAPAAFEIVYHLDAKQASKAFKRFMWGKAQRAILIAGAISAGCLVAIFAWEPNIFLILGTAYPAAYVVLWLSHLGHIDDTFDSLDGRKVRLLLDSGGISSYSGNSFKRVQWPGVRQVVATGGYYFIYYERDVAPSGSFPKDVLGEDALAFLRARTMVVE